jgi:hypothetical protein
LRHRLSLCGMFLILFASAAAVDPEPSEAGVRVVGATAAGPAHVTFRLPDVRARSVVQAVVRLGPGRGRRVLSVRRARRAVRGGRLVIRARRGAPHASGAARRRGYTLMLVTDTRPPNTRIVSRTRSGEMLVYRFKGSERRVRFECRVDRRRWRHCRTPHSYPGTGRSHRFLVRAVDRGGNVDGTPALRRWRGQGGARELAVPPGGGSLACVARFVPGFWPSGCFKPYGEASPFNRRLPANPPLAPGSAQVVDRLASWGRPQDLIVGHPEGSESDYGHPVYYARPADPVYTIQCARWTDSCDVDGVQVRIPPQALPADGGDGHMTVIDQDSGWEYDLWQVQTVPLPRDGGTVVVSHGGRTRWGTPDADGLGSNATAAHFGLQAGAIRAEEWEAAVARGGAIEHALFMSVKCSGGFSVYPAAPGTTAAPCSRFGDTNQHAPPLGGHFYLDLTEGQIDSLPVPQWKKPILKAMARYGMFVGDTFNYNDASFGLLAESDVQYRAFGHPGRYAQLGRKWGVGTYKGAYVFDVDSGVDWGRHLKLVHPCVARRAC